MTKAIELEPDRPQHYLDRVFFRSKSILYVSDSELKGTSQANWAVTHEVIEPILADYKSALQKDPTIAKSWMGLILCNVLLNEWDEAISLCGQAKPFVTDPADKAVISWLLCLALILAGDSVTDEDSKPLFEARDVDWMYIERVVAHTLMSCSDPKMPEARKEQISMLNEVFLENMGAIERSLDICRMCGYPIEKELHILEVRLLRNPEDYIAWEAKVDAIDRMIARDTGRETRVAGLSEPGDFHEFVKLHHLDSLCEKMIQAYSKTAELAPEQSFTAIEAKVQLASLLYRLGLLEETWAVAASLRLSDWSCWDIDTIDSLVVRGLYLNALCDRLIESQRSDEALDLINRDIATAEPDEAQLLADTWYIKARLEVRIGDRKSAIASLLKAIQTNLEMQDRAANDAVLKGLLIDLAAGLDKGKSGFLAKVIGWSRRGDGAQPD
ncbi:MAG: hypothetical protein ACYC1U_11150 [Candidatus Aquicultorales bacterium]